MGEPEVYSNETAALSLYLLIVEIFRWGFVNLKGRDDARRCRTLCLPARPLPDPAALAVPDAVVVRLLLVFLALVVKIAARTADHGAGCGPSPGTGSDPDDGAANDGTCPRTPSGVR